MNTAPESVNQNGLTDAVGAFFTFGPGFTMGIYVLTALGILLLAASLVAWVHTENRRLQETVDRVRLRDGGSTTGSEA
jgi:cytochrome c-type biogenesis protein CcmH/NrfF